MINKKGIFILGFRKCGTTNLYDIISNHPNYSPPKLKEPQFFALSDRIVKDNLSWYESLYEGSEWVLDGSTLYVHDARSLHRIDEYFSDKRYIVSMRDPAKRFYSAYWHMKVKGDGIERRSLDEVIHLYESMDKIDIDAESDMLVKCNNEGSISLNYLDKSYHRKKFNSNFDTEIKDEKAFFRYWGESCYSAYLNQLDADYKVVLFEELMENPKEIILELEDFIGLEGLPKAIPLNRNKTVFTPKWAKYFKQFLSKELRTYLKTKLGKASVKMDERTYNRIRKLMEPEYAFWFDKKPELKNYWKWRS